MTLRLDTTASTQFIPSASADTEGLVKLAAVVLKALDAQIAAPGAGISSEGTSTLTLVVPAGMNRLKASQRGPVLVSGSGGAQLATGAFVVAGPGVLTPAVDGRYTVTPGQTVSLVATVQNILGATPHTAPVAEWAVEFNYQFSAA